MVIRGFASFGSLYVVVRTEARLRRTGAASECGSGTTGAITASSVSIQQNGGL